MRFKTKSEFGRNVLTLISGTIIAQAIPVLLQPLLRRLFGPEEFGVFSVYLSIVGMFSVFSALRYEMAIMLPREDKAAMNIFLVTFFMNCLTALLFLLVIITLGDWIAELINLGQESVFVLYLTPLSIFMLGLGYAANFLLVRQKKFKATSINKVSRRAGEGAVQTGTGFMNTGLGLIIGDLVGHVVNLGITFYQVNKAGYFAWKISLKEMKKVLVQYSHFPKYNALPTLLNSISLLYPVLLINSKFSAEITGQFDLSRQVLALPLVIISASISQVMFQQVSESRNQNKSIKKSILKLFFTLLVLTGGGLTLFYLIGVEAFSFVFGEKWKDAGLYSEILIVGYSIKFLVSTFSIVLTALEKLRILALWQLTYFLLIILLSFITNMDIFDFLKIIVIIDLFSYFIYAVIIYRTVRTYENSIKIH